MPSFVRFALVCVFALVAGGVVFADPDYKTLKDDIKKLEKSVQDARKERSTADKNLADNRRPQKSANAAELKALKREARGLAATAGEKADVLNDTQQKLANKQAELRSTAAAHAVKQISAQGRIDDRVGEATNAVDDWKGALGSLPEVPQLRALDGIDDPEERRSVRTQDKKALEGFVSWADGETTRIDKEIKQVQEIINAKPKLVASKDGGKELVADAESLKKTLDARKKQVGDLKKSAQDQIKQIK